MARRRASKAYHFIMINQTESADAPHTKRHAPSAIFCSVFSIDFIVIVVFGSCLMIASQEA